MEPFENRVWLSSPTTHEHGTRYVEEAYRTNWISTVGENINQIEYLMCQKLGCRYAVGLASGTSALHLAVKLAGIRPGDRVFCSDLTFAASVNPILYEGGIPVFIDSERDTWNMDPEALERAFARYPDAKAVIVVNLYGTPAKLDELAAIARHHGAVFIEDAAESLGATYRGKQTGTFGLANAISFNGNKIITGSSGGMLLTDDEALARKTRKWSTQSRENVPWYQHTEVGYNYRMSNIIAGIIRAQVPHLEEHIARKKAIFQRYQEGFRDLPVSMNPYDLECMEPNFWLSCLLIDRDAMCSHSRDDFQASFASEPGKSCPTEILQALESYNAEGRPIWKPMHLQPIYKAYPFVCCQSSAVSQDLFDRGVCLPSDIKMTAEQQDQIIEIVRSCFE